MKSGLDVVAPLTRLRIGRMLVPHLLPGMFPEGMPWHRVSAKLVGRLFAAQYRPQALAHHRLGQIGPR